MGLCFGFRLCQAQVLFSCVADSSGPASGQGLSFLAGLGLTVRHRPYLKLVISFLFISAAIQVPLALALAILTLCLFRFSLPAPLTRVGLKSREMVAGTGSRESGAGRRET